MQLKSFGNSFLFISRKNERGRRARSPQHLHLLTDNIFGNLGIRHICSKSYSDKGQQDPLWKGLY